MGDPLPVGSGVIIPDDELHESFARSGGPGGQHVNTSATKVELRWHVAASTVLSDAQRARLLDRLEPRLTADGELIIVDGSTRSQDRNRQAARRRLAAIVSEALRPTPPRRPTRPPAASRRRRVESKRQRSETKRLRRRPNQG